jgi:hypothetical protein
VTRRIAKGTGTPPVHGEFLMPEPVRSILPPVRGREVVAWLVTGEAAVATVAEIRWGVSVVGVARRSH